MKALIKMLFMVVVFILVVLGIFFGSSGTGANEKVSHMRDSVEYKCLVYGHDYINSDHIWVDTTVCFEPIPEDYDGWLSEERAAYNYPLFTFNSVDSTYVSM